MTQADILHTGLSLGTVFNLQIHFFSYKCCLRQMIKSSCRAVTIFSISLALLPPLFFSFCWPQLLTKITHQHFLTYRHRHFCINFKLIDPFFIDDFLVENLSLKMANGFIFGDLENII